MEGHSFNLLLQGTCVRLTELADCIEYPATLIYSFVISIYSFVERGIQTVVVRTCGVF